MNFRHIRVYLSLFLLMITLTLSGQVTIDFPVERTVFQRNNNNLGFINISGAVSQDCDRIEARLTARSEGQGVNTPWISIDTKVIGRSFIGKVQNSGGWYKLEVRSIKDNEVLGTATINRVGIGEVFVISGQSNAQGYGENPNPNGAVDDRVNGYAINYFQAYKTDIYENLPEFFSEMKFEKIGPRTNIGPGGYTAYHYGELGDMLVKKLNVPVLFFNAGFTGTSSRNWELSSRNLPTSNEFFINNEFPLGQPYVILKKTLQSINKILGVRSILWHQGEYDGYFRVNVMTYYDNIKKVIEKSRSDIGANIPWVIARTSRYLGRTSNEIIAAQNRLISEIPFTWPGPETDNIQPNRYDGGHFQNRFGDNGLTQLATSWNEYLTSDFFQKSVSLLPADLVSLQHYCVQQNQVRVSPSTNFVEYYWNTGQKTQSIDISSGEVSLLAKDRSGNIYRSNHLKFAGVFPSAPKIMSASGFVGCEGQNLTFWPDSDKYFTIWNESYTGDTIRLSQSGTIYAKYKSEQNCYSDMSQSATVKFVAPPSKPQVSFINSDGNECEGTSLSLAVNNMQGAGAVWSNGQGGNEFVIHEDIGPITVKLFNIPNCFSPPSDPLDYHFYENPSEPTIERAGPFFLQANSITDDVSFKWFNNGVDLGSSDNGFFNIHDAGEFRVIAGKSYKSKLGKTIQCFSVPSEAYWVEQAPSWTGFSVFPNPSTDGRFMISSDEEVQNVDVRLFDILGKEVYHENLESLSFPRVIDISSRYFSGKYYLRIIQGSKSSTFPLIFIK